jgi:hypothetical protein
MPAANLLIAVVSDNNHTQPIDNQSNTYTYAILGAGNAYSTIWYCYLPSSSGTSSSHTFSCATLAGNRPSIAVLAFSGALASPLDQTGANGTLDTGNQSIRCVATSPGSITPTTSGQLLIAGLCSVFTTTAPTTIDSGFGIDQFAASLTGSLYFGVGAAHLVQATAAAVNPDWAWTTFAGTPDPASACIASFKGSGWTLVAHTVAQSTDGTSVTTSPIDTTGGGAAVVPFIPGRRRSPFLIRRKLYVKTG